MENPEVKELLRVSHVSFSYNADRYVLFDVSFDVCPGQVVGLIGANGAGKTTLIKLIFNVLSLKKGEIRVAGSSNRAAPARLSSIYLSTNDNMPGFLTGEEYVHLFESLYGVCHDDTRTSHLLRRYGLFAQRDRLIEDYSHGMKKKLQFVTALVLSRPLTVIDETLNGIDMESLYYAADDIRSQCDADSAVLLCTHDFAMLERIADRIVLVHDGIVEYDGSVDEIHDEYGSIESLTMNKLGIEYGRTAGGGVRESPKDSGIEAAAGASFEKNDIHE